MVRVSVIVPIYNVERYLRQCLDSLLGQTLKDIEIICVDDGSADSSGAIADEYAARDRRVRAVHQANAGAGAARNAGLELACGEYLFFCDPDDFCKRTMLQEMYRRATETNADVVVAGRLIYDEDLNRVVEKRGFPAELWLVPQPFSGVDIPLDIFTFGKNSPWDKLFRRAYVMEQGFRFQCIRRVNDCYFVSMALACAERIALVRGAYYYYRRDRVGGLQSTKDSSPHCVYEAYDALKDSLVARGLFGRYKSGYARALISSGCYNLRTLQEPDNVRKSYAMLRERLRALAEEDGTGVPLVLRGHHLSRMKTILASEEYDGWFDSKVATEWRMSLAARLPFALKEWLKITWCVFRRLRKARQSWRPLEVEYLSVVKDRLEIQGVCSFRLGRESPVVEGLALVCRTADGEMSAHAEEVGRKVVAGLVASVPEKLERVRFRISLPLPEARTEAVLTWRFAGLPQFGWSCARQSVFSALADGLRSAYFVAGSRLFRLCRDGLYVSRASTLSLWGVRTAYSLEAIWRFPRASAKAAAIVLAYRLSRLFERRPLWLFSDRVDKADDNARALFEYACALPRSAQAAHFVFVVERGTKDFGELRKVGRVVNIAGWRYKILFLLADFQISAYHTGVQRRPFSSEVWQLLKPIACRGRFVYLCHGITKNDMSKVQGRAHMNARLLMTSSPRERQFILDAPYGYTAREIRLCGMPRYDLLYDHRGRNITIMPTWRQYLMKRMGLNGVVLKPEFSQSTFFLTYRAFFRDSRLKEACARLGYVIRLMPHPNMREVLESFDLPEDLEVLPPNARYRDVFADSGIVVTDYSSVFFDVGYLRKPIVHFQPDRDEFFANQYDLGYFDYDRDGFGEVETTVDGLVSRIIEYMESGAEMKSEYVRRVADFFAFADKDNSRRVYDAICEAEAEDRL